MRVREVWSRNDRGATVVSPAMHCVHSICKVQCILPAIEETNVRL